MKNLIFLIVFVLPLRMSQAQTYFYEHPDFDEIVKKQELVAILPFNTTINLRPKEMKKISSEQLMELEESGGFSIQSAMYSWFLKRDVKSPLKTDFQNPEETNAKLKMVGVKSENITEYSPEEIADFLEVDGIIMGTFETSAPMSLGTSLTLGWISGIFGSTNKAKVNLSIFNSGDGILLANYQNVANGPWDSTTEYVIDMLMKKASKKLSYSE